MNSYQENKVSMYFKVHTFFKENEVTLASALPALPDYVSDFNLLMDEFTVHEMKATENNKGYAKQKKMYRSEMSDHAVVIVGGLQAYALSTEDKNLSEEIHLTRGAMRLLRDTDILFKCENLFIAANQYAEKLLKFSITPLKINAFNDCIIKYRDFIERPKAMKGERKTARSKAKICMLAIDQKLNLIDYMMDTISLELPLIYSQYYSARSIDHNRSRAVYKPVASITIPPNTIMAGYSIEYLSRRSFKVKNTGAGQIKWGLSPDSDRFSNSIKTIGPRSISKRMSKTLGTTGDNLVFENTNAIAVTVKISVME